MPESQDRTLQEWLSWIERCHPSEIELGLERLTQVYQRLALDLSASRKVIIGGTNGKGSTVALLDQVLRDAGYSVGCFTSPHFLRYNERIKLAGQPVEDALLVEAFEAIDQARESTSLTYFEYNTLAALYIFSRQKPDVMLLEVGLGGRLDAVNIIDADLAIVTTVSVDHVDWLGDDREKIGYEKAGIYRAGKPALCGDPNPPKMLLDYAAELGADLYCRGETFELNHRDDGLWDWRGRSVVGTELQLNNLPDINLPKANAATVLQALQILQIEIDHQALCTSLKRAGLTGRMQKIEYKGYTYLLDVAHNPEASAYLTQRLQQRPVQGRNILILGMLADKDIDQVISSFKSIVDQWLLVTLDVPRGQSAAQLAEKSQQQNIPVDSQTTYDTVQEAISDLQTQLQPDDRVIIAGSFFTVSDALIALNMDGR